MADLTKDERKLRLVDTTLDGATERGPFNSYPADAGEFAARWNAKTETERDEWVRFMVDEALEAQRADRVAFETANRAMAAERQVAEFQAVIAKLAELHADRYADTGHIVRESDALMGELLAAGPHDVLDAALADARRTVLDVPRVVAHHWQYVLMGMLDRHPVLAAGTHAVAMIQTALDGETRAAELGMTPDEFEAARAELRKGGE